MTPRPANVIAWMAALLVLAVGGFMLASGTWEQIMSRVVDPVLASAPPVPPFAVLSPAEVVRVKAGVAVMTDVFVVLPVALLAVIVCAAPAGSRRTGWLIGLATAISFWVGVLLARLVILEPLQNSGRVVDVDNLRAVSYLLFFAGTMLVFGIAFVVPAVYALARLRSPAAGGVVTACGIAILALVLGVAVMPGFGLSTLTGQLLILAVVFAAVYGVERLARMAFTDPS